MGQKLGSSLAHIRERAAKKRPKDALGRPIPEGKGEPERRKERRRGSRANVAKGTSQAISATIRETKPRAKPKPNVSLVTHFGGTAIH